MSAKRSLWSVGDLVHASACLKSFPHIRFQCSQRSHGRIASLALPQLDQQIWLKPFLKLVVCWHCFRVRLFTPRLEANLRVVTA